MELVLSRSRRYNIVTRFSGFRQVKLTGISALEINEANKGKKGEKFMRTHDTCCTVTFRLDDVL